MTASPAELLQRVAAACGLWVQKTGRRSNPYRDLPSWSYQEPLVSHHISKGDIVLDVGSGNNPSPRADLLADFFPDDDFHRSGDVAEHKPLLVCSVDRIPLRKRSMDFVICSHVLEHVPDPARAAAELSRIARAGYAETPAYGKDVLIGTGYMHRWQVVVHDGMMFFFEYTRRQQEAHVASPVMKIWLSDHFHPWQEYFWSRQDLFNAWVLWKGALPVQVHRYTSLRPAARWKPVDEKTLPAISCTLTDGEIALLEHCLATPDGTGRMVFRDGRFVQRSGTIQYPVRGKRVYCEMGIQPLTPKL
jgi:SAM-dependent methyltransferase